jgi:hypothetical protein
MTSPVPAADEVKTLIRKAFAQAPYPGDDHLLRSQGDEPDEVADLFRGKDDWSALAPDFVDRAGAASPSALSFFSPAAFRFYLPAYLLADIDDQLVYTDPLFYLYFGLDEATRRRPAGTAGGPALTWWEAQQEHLAPMSAAEAAAVVAYLRWKVAKGTLHEHERRSVAEALRSYWLERAGEPAP